MYFVIFKLPYKFYHGYLIVWNCTVQLIEPAILSHPCYTDFSSKFFSQMFSRAILRAGTTDGI